MIVETTIGEQLIRQLPNAQVTKRLSNHGKYRKVAISCDSVRSLDIKWSPEHSVLEDRNAVRIDPIGISLTRCYSTAQSSASITRIIPQVWSASKAIVPDKVWGRRFFYIFVLNKHGNFCVRRSSQPCHKGCRLYVGAELEVENTVSDRKRRARGDVSDSPPLENGEIMVERRRCLRCNPMRHIRRDYRGETSLLLYTDVSMIDIFVYVFIARKSQT